MPAAVDQPALRPVDVAVALRLAWEPDARFADVAADLGVSPSTAHEAVARLGAARLVSDERESPRATRRGSQRYVNRAALLEFLEHGVRFAFPAQRLAGRRRGVPTAFPAAFVKGDPGETVDPGEVLVWPAAHGSAEGFAITPLYAGAVDLPTRCPKMHRLLALVDALRVGQARERAAAARSLRVALQAGAAA